MKRLSIITVCLALAFLAEQRTFAQNGHDLFQKGLVQERTQGDLDEAIRLYQQIVEDHTDDRTLVAKALLQMGGCYEKLGRVEARRAYERVVREFADQSEPVSAARARLTDLGRQKGEEGPILRRVYGGDVGYPVILSHDGKLSAFVDYDTGDSLSVRDLTSGQVRRLTKESLSEPHAVFGEQAIFSPDDEQIAYNWQIPERKGPWRAQLRIISADGTGERILYPPKKQLLRIGETPLRNPIAWHAF